MPGQFTAPRETRQTYYRVAEINKEAASIVRLRKQIVDRVARQIRRATESDVNPVIAVDDVPNDGDFATPGSAFAWISQPGMIRTYRDSLEELAFPLFSHEETTLDLKGLDFLILKNTLWDNLTNPLLGTDLNAPHTTEDGERRYPILDPRLFTEDGVEGLTILDHPNSNLDEALPMPTSWLYQLSDGSLATLNANGKLKGPTQPSEDNPIVARVAYWTDDESCKINVNTASEAIPWDTPRAESAEERAFGEAQPVTEEVHRYSGHPATTSLSSTLFPRFYASAYEPETQRLSEDALSALHELSDRSTSPYQTVDDWADRAQTNPTLAELPQLHRLSGLLTTESHSPELNVHGRPRMSVWPAHENTGPGFQNGHDRASSDAATLGNERYYFQRRDPNSPYTDFYLSGDGNNAKLYQYVMSQAYRKNPGIGGSLAQKYGATMRYFDFQDSFESKFDHTQNLLMMFDYIRGVNSFDGQVANPFVPLASMGQVTGMSMLGRDLNADNGIDQHESKFSEPTLEPKGIGRDYVVSEVALVLYQTAEVTITDWSDGIPRFNRGSGSTSDQNVMKAIIQNEHPKYSEWTGREYGPEDAGKTFKYIEAGLVPELFCTGQGYHPIRPRLSLRLQTGGKGYKRGLDEFAGLRVNGIPLLLWGDSRESPDTQFQGPLVSTLDPTRDTFLDDVPNGWFAWGGRGGPRITQFGTFTVGRDDPGFFGSEFLANGFGPLAHFYCQTGVIVEADQPITLSQIQPMQLLVHNAIGADVNESNLVQTLNLQFPTTVFEEPLANTGSFSGWTRRFRSAASSSPEQPISVLESGLGREVVKGLSVSHGDYRHLAAKRNVPRLLYRPHPLVEKERSAHSLSWSSNNGTSIPSHTTFSDELSGRGLVKGVDYHENARTDFTFDPKDRDQFAPLLHPIYRFPIDPSITRDWDNGTGNASDGPYTNKPDEGADKRHSLFAAESPYFSGSDLYFEDDVNNFNPHRMIPSPVAFGSLPSAVQTNAPWTCLLFRPNLANPGINPHLGERGNGLRYLGDLGTRDGILVPQFQSLSNQDTLPADHQWLDLFWMPTVQDRGLTKQWATAGKVNMNYEMVPFSYIKRATALHAVLKSERLLCIPTTEGGRYKEPNEIATWRRQIDATETLKAFQHKFSQDEHFLTESEICEQFLIPQGETWDANGENMRSFWDQHRLTGDNSLERPYANIYPRLTTRSNVFRVHMHLELLDEVNLTEDGAIESVGPAHSSYRGNAVLERYLDTTAPNFPSYIEDTHQDRLRLEHFYQFRTIRSEAFPN